ncbi:hypothetical protein K2173_022473 [Erythroxylum novogranatense]|uniref:Peroxidase n=1 Tax=Erythroxylum novogranatense TaxID=1862640 RepID=A0AAV8TJX1_9ROSI|nr:hypothetical protein K2173_022473 [Erythroxylum novogranatense]
MTSRHVIVSCFLFYVVCLGTVGCNGQWLRRGFYEFTCPGVERFVRDFTWSKVQYDPTLPAKLIRMHFHDCFVRGCDASLLIDRIGSTQAEKDAVPNLTVSGFEVIDELKAEIERVCPGIVSCADILSLAARDAASYQFRRPLWEVLTGRRDGRVSLASDAIQNIPSPFSNFTSLMQSFFRKGLNLDDLVALSGAHTIGVSRNCSNFAARLYNFTGRGDPDPSLDPLYAQFLRTICPNPINFPATEVEMDPESSLSFDTKYFTNLLQNRGLFQSDAALLSDGYSTAIVRRLQRPNVFFVEFARSMKKMSTIDVLTGNAGEIRKNCRVVN